MAQVDFVVPAERLAKLTPNEPEAYRDLAEEMSLIRDSQTAKDLTIRLYLISAKLGSDKLRRSAIRGLVKSARNPKEQRKFRVLGFLSDPQFSDMLLEPLKNATSPPPKGLVDSNETPQSKLLDALISIRQGKSLRAKKIMENKLVQNQFAKFKDIMPLSEFNEACLMSELPNSVLYKILLIDRKIRNGDSDQSPIVKAKTMDEIWGELFRGKLPPRIPDIQFDTVTEFDPTQTIFSKRCLAKTP